MRLLTCFLAAMATTSALAIAADAPQKAAPLMKQTCETRDLPRTRQDRQYQLCIGLPASYDKEPNRKYPVVYVADGYWQYDTVRQSYWGMVYDGTIPEVIVVGLGYVGENLDYNQLRNFDLGPPSVSTASFAPGEMAFHGDQFLEVLEKSAIPLIEREYRADLDFYVMSPNVAP